MVVILSHIPFAMLHQGSVMYVKNAFNGIDCCLRCSFQKWNVCVNPLLVHSGLQAPSSNSEIARKPHIKKINHFQRALSA